MTRVLLWNVLLPYGLEKTQFPQNKRISNIASVITESGKDFDFIGLCELDLRNKQDVVKKFNTKYTYYDIKHSRENEGLCLLSRPSIEHQRTVKLSNGKFVKKALISHTKELEITLIHLTFGFTKEKTRLSEIRNALDAIRSNNKKSIIIGDFNTLPTSKVREEITKAGYSSTMSSMGYTSTFPRGNSVNFWKRLALPKGISIDDIYYKGFELESCGTINGDSDHLAIWVELK